MSTERTRPDFDPVTWEDYNNIDSMSRRFNAFIKDSSKKAGIERNDAICLILNIGTDTWHSFRNRVGRSTANDRLYAIMLSFILMLSENALMEMYSFTGQFPFSGNTLRDYLMMTLFHEKVWQPLEVNRRLAEKGEDPLFIYDSEKKKLVMEHVLGGNFDLEYIRLVTGFHENSGYIDDGKPIFLYRDPVKVEGLLKYISNWAKAAAEANISGEAEAVAHAQEGSALSTGRNPGRGHASEPRGTLLPQDACTDEPAGAGALTRFDAFFTSHVEKLNRNKSDIIKILEVTPVMWESFRSHMGMGGSRYRNLTFRLIFALQLSAEDARELFRITGQYEFFLNDHREFTLNKILHRGVFDPYEVDCMLIDEGVNPLFGDISLRTYINSAIKRADEHLPISTVVERIGLTMSSWYSFLNRSGFGEIDREISVKLCRVLKLSPRDSKTLIKKIRSEKMKR